MLSSGMWLRVALVRRTDVSEEHIVSILRVTRLNLPRSQRRRASWWMAKRTSCDGTTVLLTRVTWRHIPEDNIVNCNRREKLFQTTAFFDSTQPYILFTHLYTCLVIVNVTILLGSPTAQRPTAGLINRERHGMRRLWPNLMQYPRIYLKGLNESTKNLSDGAKIWNQSLLATKQEATYGSLSRSHGCRLSGLAKSSTWRTSSPIRSVSQPFLLNCKSVPLNYCPVCQSGSISNSGKPFLTPSDSGPDLKLTQTPLQSVSEVTSRIVRLCLHPLASSQHRA
jgi:hypothetical protein